MEEDKLKDLLEKLKEATGVDLTGQVEKVVLARSEDLGVGDNISSEKLQELSKFAGNPSQEDLDLFLNILSDSSEVGNVCFTYVQNSSVEGWDFRTSASDFTVSACSASASLIYYAATDTFVYNPNLESDFGIEIAYKLPSEFTRNDCVSALSIICGHIKYLMETYNYLMPPLDLCEEFVDKVLEFKETLDAYISSKKFNPLKED